MSQCPFCNADIEGDDLQSGNANLVVCAQCFNPLLLNVVTGGISCTPIPDTRDTRQIAAPGSVTAALLEQASSAMEQLPVLPEISQRILRLLKDPEFGMPELVAMVREDSVLALAVMKQANSVAYGGLQPVTDLNGACTRLGMKAVANIVQLVANRNLFITGDARLRNLMERLWRHSVATAHCATEIGRLTLAPNTESLFLAGLAHDIGKVVLLDMIASPRSRVLRENSASAEVVMEVLASLHSLFGLLVCQEWRLPPELRSAVYFHHNPERCPASDWLNATHTIALANTIVRVEGYGTQHSLDEAFLASDPSSVYLGLSDIKIATLRVDLSDALEALFEAAG